MTLERHDFQRLLFRTAFCLMACDGHIDEREVNEIKWMNTHSNYFKGIDLSDELEELLRELKVRGKHIVDELYSDLSDLNLSSVQELLILEIAFRIAHTDEKVHENEIKLIRYLRSKLHVHDEIIHDRFGVVEYLFDKDYSQEIIKQDAKDDLLAHITLPDFKEIGTFDFTLPAKN